MRKTEYEMRISDWSSDVCSSDLILLQLLFNAFPILLLIAVWVYFMRQMQGGGAGRGAMSFGKSRARMLNADQVKITFNDVAGCEEAKQEVSELVDFLKDPGKFQKRSEEHTSELQSLMRISYAVFCLKNNKHKT